MILSPSTIWAQTCEPIQLESVKVPALSLKQHEKQQLQKQKPKRRKQQQEHHAQQQPPPRPWSNVLHHPHQQQQQFAQYPYQYPPGGAPGQGPFNNTYYPPNQGQDYYAGYYPPHMIPNEDHQERDDDDHHEHDEEDKDESIISLKADYGGLSLRLPSSAQGGKDHKARKIRYDAHETELAYLELLEQREEATYDPHYEEWKQSQRKNRIRDFQVNQGVKAGDKEPDCQPVEWHDTVYPTCNVVHELDFAGLYPTDNSRFLGYVPEII